MNTDRHIPVVFVSSTCYDLKQVREDLEPVFTRRKERGKIEIWKKKDGSRTLAT